MKKILVIAIVLVGSLVAATAPAQARAPERISEEVNVTFLDPVACGVPLEVNVAGTVRTKLFRDDSGNLERVIQHVDFTETYTNLATATTLTAPNVGAVVHVDIGAADDGRDIVRFTGLQGHIIVPGVGSVVMDSGQTVLWALPGAEATVISQVGNNEGGPFPAACEYLQ